MPGHTLKDYLHIVGLVVAALAEIAGYLTDQQIVSLLPHEWGVKLAMIGAGILLFTRSAGAILGKLAEGTSANAPAK